MPKFMPEMQLTLGEVFGWLKPGNVGLGVV
jgi:hypothetical protein